MDYGNFTLTAYPRIVEAMCPKCRHDLKEVSNGWFSSAMFCPKCETAFALKLIKIPDNKVNPKWRDEARQQANKALERDRVAKVKQWAQDHEVEMSSEAVEQLRDILGGSL